MSINSVSSSSLANASQVRQQQPEANEVKKAGRETRNDGDSDDGKATATVASKPSVNSNGQAIGTIISTQA